MLVYLVVVYTWWGTVTGTGRPDGYATERACWDARSTMAIRHGRAVCEPTWVPGT